MTVKVNEVVVDALEHIVVQQDEAPIEASEGRAAMRALNDMMFAWDAQGVSLGYTAVSDLGDDVTVALGAVMGIKAGLAIVLASRYEVPVTIELKEAFKEGWKAILALTVDTAESELPPTLPQGSGNTYPSYTDSVFFPDSQDDILTETGGAIALEDDTEGA